MRRNAGGTIVNVSSDAAVEGYAGWGGYGSAKAALEQMSRILAVELEGTNVSVIVADPGDMDTDLHRLAVPDADPSELADPRTVAPALLRAIASPRAAFTRVALQHPDVALPNADVTLPNPDVTLSLSKGEPPALAHA
jgi:NAD(P)-dependent dehydrogenase (short-subunit alcohol dehydrogenase family)